jgi:iron-sulfur cluster assembly protein
MITTTELAASKIAAMISKRGKGLGIRVGTKRTGCSGLAYILEYVDVVTDDMIEYPSNGTVVFVTKTDAPLLQDLEIDYKKKGLNEGFEFNNPLETGRCGCGESFRV